MKKLNNRKVNVLGTEYTIRFKKEKEDEKLTLCDAYFDFSTKEIIIGIFKKEINDCNDREMYLKNVLKHELIHAFLYESGLHGNTNSNNYWAVNEEMVDWIALQHQKMQKVFVELGIEG